MTTTIDVPRPTISQLSPGRLYAMRGGYLLMAVGLMLVKWPKVLEAHSMPLYEGVTWCLLTAMSLLAFLGLRYPVTMLPVLLFETVWKLLWFGVVALPRALDGGLHGGFSTVAVNCSLDVVIIAVVPWRYVWDTLVGVRAREVEIVVGSRGPESKSGARVPRG